MLCKISYITEEKAKKIEAERRSIARNARLEHRNSLKSVVTASQFIKGLKDIKESKKDKGPAPEPPPRYNFSV